MSKLDPFISHMGKKTKKNRTAHLKKQTKYEVINLAGHSPFAVTNIQKGKCRTYFELD
jgi:hypothetical protein